MNLPRLPLPAERLILKGACEMAPRAQRLLFGPPPTIDDQTLATDIHVLLCVSKMAGKYSYTEGHRPEQARKVSRHDAKVATPRRPLPLERVAGLEIPGSGGPIPARHYIPRHLPGGVAPPLLVYFHGGGWVVGDLDTHDTACRFLAAASGVQVLSVDYRLAPEHPFPAPVEDAWSAYAWALENAEELGADPRKVAVGGDSAGGNMAAVVCIVARDDGFPPPAFQLLIYPPTDPAEPEKMRSRDLFAEGFMLTRADMEYFEALYLPPGTDRSDRRISIVQNSDLAGLPPAFLVTAGFDPLRDEGEMYGIKVREAGGRIALRRYPGLIHGFVNETAVCRSSRAAMLEIAGALRMGLA